MRADPSEFAGRNLAPSKDPFYVVAVSWDTANTDITYLTSHANADYPAGADVITGVIQDINGTSQSLDPINALATIGNLDFSAIDKGGALTNKINVKLTAGDGLREKRVQVSVGYKGLAWSDYVIVQTQQIADISFGGSNVGALYKFRCSDIQRSTRKEIFDLAETNLTANIDIGTIEDISNANPGNVKSPGHGKSTSDKVTIRNVGGTTEVNGNEYTITVVDDDNFTIGVDTTSYGVYTGGGFWGDATISVVSTTDFETYPHGTSYSDAPSATVGYFRIKDTVYRYTGKTATTFTGVIHAVHGTKPVKQDIGTVTENDRKPKVTEFVYLEEPAVQIALRILLGTYGGKTLPSRWSLGIDTTWVNESAFENIGKDVWDTTDDTAGFVAYGAGLKKTDAKRFLEKEIYLLLGLFSPVLTNGQLSLRRMSNILNDAAYTGTLDTSNVISYSDLKHDMDNVYNVFEINWNWDFLKEEFTRHDTLIDQGSINTHGRGKTHVMNFKLLNGASHTDMTLALRRDAARDRYSGPPLRTGVTCKHSMNRLEPGDVQRVDLPNVRDFTDGITGIDRSMEVQKSAIDWVSGDVVLDLFGSSQKPGAISLTSLSTVLADAWYTSAGTLLSSVLTMSGNNVTASGTLTGNADMNAAGAIYYHNADLIIDAGVVVTLGDNVQIRYKGHLTVNGTIDGVGQGNAGAVAPTPTSIDDKTDGAIGLIGSLISGGGLLATSSPTFSQEKARAYEGHQVEGLFSSVPGAELVYDGTNLTGIPGDMRGTSGSSGRAARSVKGIFAKAGDGGASGAGLCLIGRGLSFGGAGGINLSGSDGAEGDATPAGSTANVIYNAGSGAGGAPGGLLVIVDGNFSEPSIAGNFTADRGRTPVNGIIPTLVSDSGGYVINAQGSPAYSPHIANGDSLVSMKNSAFRVQYVPENLTAKPDVAAQAGLPVFNSITVTNKANFSDNTIGVVSISVTAPSDENYKEANIYYKKATVAAWILLGSIAGAEVITVDLPLDGTAYNFKAHSVSTSLVESDDFTTATEVLTTSIGEKAEFMASNWTERANPKNFILYGIVYGAADDLWVAVGDADGTDSYIITSSNGVDWIEQAPTVAKNLRLNSVAYGGGIFVAVGWADGTDGYILTSTDGATWTERGNPDNRILYGVTYDGTNSQFIAVGNADATDAYIITSPNGTTWTERSNAKQGTLRGVVEGGGVLVAVGDVTAASDAYILTSTDGATWTERSNPSAQGLNSVAYGVVAGAGLFVAVGQNGGLGQARIMTSPDGINWTSRNNPQDVDLNKVTFGFGIFVAVGDNISGDAYILTSRNGIDWIERKNPKNTFLNAIDFGDGVFITAGGQLASYAYLLTSLFDV